MTVNMIELGILSVMLLVVKFGLYLCMKEMDKNIQKMTKANHYTRYVLGYLHNRDSQVEHYKLSEEYR